MKHLIKKSCTINKIIARFAFFLQLRYIIYQLHLTGALLILQVLLLSKIIPFSSKMLDKIPLLFKRCKFFFMVLPTLGPLDFNFVEVFTAWKVSVFGVFLVRIQFKCGKIRTRKTPNTDTFHAVFIFWMNFFVQSHFFSCSLPIYFGNHCE